MSIITHTAARHVARQLDGLHQPNDLVAYMRTTRYDWDGLYIWAAEYDLLEDIVYYYGQSLDTGRLTVVREDQICTANNLTLTESVGYELIVGVLQVWLYQELGTLFDRVELKKVLGHLDNE